MTPFRVAVSHDLLEVAEKARADVGLTLLDQAADVTYEVLADEGPELSSSVLAGYDGLLLLAPGVTANTLVGADQLKIIARCGVGYDNIDLEACTKAGVLVTVTPDGVRRPMATAMLSYLLALSTNLVHKDRSMHAGEWAPWAHLGHGLTRRVLGLIGVGNIGRQFLQLAAPLEMRTIAYDPYIDGSDLAPLDVEVTDLESVLSSADYVFVACPLSDETRHLVNRPRLSLMKPSACLVNVARGPIVDEVALIDALQSGQIRAAALDVYENEPLPEDSPLRFMDNVLLAPHSIGWSDEIFERVGRSACRALLDVSQDRVPNYVVNPEALQNQDMDELHADSQLS